MAARTLVHRGVELEEDLVTAVGDVQHQPGPLASMRPLQDTLRQAEIDKRTRPCIEPVGREAEDGRRVLDRLLERAGQCRDRDQAGVFHQADDIDVPRRSRDQPEQL